MGKFMKRLFQFLSSRYRNHQAGFALNIVIIFMLLSQLLYWSLIVKNQYATRQYKQYQRHYLNQIQLLVSEKLFEGVILDQLGDFQSEVERKLSERIRDFLTEPIDEWLIQTPQMGLAKLKMNIEDTLLCLYYFEIDCDELLREYMLSHPPQSWQVNQWLVVERNQNIESRLQEDMRGVEEVTQNSSEIEYQAMIQTLTQMGYIPAKLPVQREYLYQYQFSSLPNQWNYDDGLVQLKTDTSTGQTLYYLVSQRNQDESGRISQLIFRDPYYRIKMEIQWFIKTSSVDFENT